MAEQTDLERVERAHAALKIQNSITALALRHATRSSSWRSPRSWLDYMDRQIALNDRDHVLGGCWCGDIHSEPLTWPPAQRDGRIAESGGGLADA